MLWMKVSIDWGCTLKLDNGSDWLTTFFIMQGIIQGDDLFDMYVNWLENNFSYIFLFIRIYTSTVQGVPQKMQSSPFLIISSK